MLDEEKFELLLPLAYQWSHAQEELVLEQGTPLGPRQIADARRVGVRESARVRMLVVERILLPDQPELADAARRAQIITDASRAVAIGHAIIIRADCWQNRELILHQLVHVAQCERCGGLEPYLRQYLGDRRTCADFSVGRFEEEARQLAREICAADAALEKVA